MPRATRHENPRGAPFDGEATGWYRGSDRTSAEAPDGTRTMASDEETSTFPGPPERVRSGIGGLDVILGGGLFEGGIYVITGSPGAGKTVLANQMGFQHVRDG